MLLILANYFKQLTTIQKIEEIEKKVPEFNKLTKEILMTDD